MVPITMVALLTNSIHHLSSFGLEHCATNAGAGSSNLSGGTIFSYKGESVMTSDKSDKITGV